MYIVDDLTGSIIADNLNIWFNQEISSWLAKETVAI